MDIRRGDIYFVELGPKRGREIDDKRRPVLVISINFINKKPLVVTVIPGSTSKGKKPYKNEVQVEPSEANGLEHPTIFQCHQMKALDHSRFDRPRVGVISSDDLLKIEKAVKYCLGLV